MNHVYFPFILLQSVEKQYLLPEAIKNLKLMWFWSFTHLFQGHASTDDGSDGHSIHNRKLLWNDAAGVI